jgi:hypothetical protein
VTISCLAQNKRLPPPPVFQKSVRTNNAKYTLQKRISFYPFNKSAQIKIVSFGLQLDSNQRQEEKNYKLPILNDTICFSKLDQIISLNLSQADTLTDILFNECSRWNLTEYSEAGCYYPRNAILFFDKAGHVFEYMEICFECSKVELSSAKFVKPDLCNYMYKDLEKIFNRVGIKTSYYELKRNSQ